LFAGTGIFSFEALSRGAAAATAIESASRAVEQIRETATALGLAVNVVSGDVLAQVPHLKPSEPYTLVYADPPYGFDQYAKLLEVLANSSAIAEGAVIVIEHATSTKDFPTSQAGLRFRRTAHYGSITLALFDKENE
jgi:16S rRNA (guanine966-N2)-methyltransferase